MKQAAEFEPITGAIAVETNPVSPTNGSVPHMTRETNVRRQAEVERKAPSLGSHVQAQNLSPSEPGEA